MKGVAALTHDVKVGGTVGTVGSSHHPLVGDEGAAAEPGVVDEESHLPGPGVLRSLNSSNDPSLLPGGALNAAGGLGLLAEVLLVGRGDRCPHLSGHTVDLLHQVVPVGIDHGGPGLVLAQVTALCWPPVLLRTEPAALRGGLGGEIKSVQKSSNLFIIEIFGTVVFSVLFCIFVSSYTGDSAERSDDEEPHVVVIQVLNVCGCACTHFYSLASPLIATGQAHTSELSWSGA